MQGYGPETFGEFNAAEYDMRHDPGNTAEAVACLAELAAGNRVLELAIGTGRVALPLAACGLTVDGIEASQLMVDQMRAKPGGSDIAVTIGDMKDADAPSSEPYGLVTLVFNTLFNLTHREDQILCLENAARHLKPGGFFVAEAYVLDTALFQARRTFLPRKLGAEEAVWEEAAYHAASGCVDYRYFRFTANGVNIIPLPTRYAAPAEIDEMAAQAGLKLHHRWADWLKAPYTEDSPAHISVYRKAK